jgi:hypothetical protein
VGEFDIYRWTDLRGISGPQLGALYDSIPDIAPVPLDHETHKATFLYALERLMREGQLLVDLRFDPKLPPWGTVQSEVIDWFRSNLPSEEVVKDGLWWIDNSARLDGWYPGACVWRAAAMNGSDIWA